MVVLGRAFLRRLINLTIGIRRPYHKVYLNKAAQADLDAWELFLQSFNGKAIMLPDIWEDSNTLQLVTDSAGSVGHGAILGADWFYGKWYNFFGFFSNYCCL